MVGCGGTERRTRAGLGLTEVLIAAGLLAILIVPILDLSSQGVARANDETARSVASMLGSNAMARLGSRGPELEGLLTVALEGGQRRSEDLLAHPELETLAKEIGAREPDVAPLVKFHSIAVVLRLVPRIVPGGDLLVCEATWKTVMNGITIENRALFERLVVDDTL